MPSSARTLALIAVLGLGAACSRPATQTTATTAPPLAAAPVAAPAAPTLPATASADAPAGASAAAGGSVHGYSCSFPGPSGRTILARFTVDGGAAHDDQGLPFTVLTDSPTALVLAHGRDDLGAAAGGDVGAYVVAIDRRTLGMVQSSVGVNGPGDARRGRCIAG